MISTGMPGRPFSDPKDSRRTGLSGRNCPRRSEKAILDPEFGQKLVSIGLEVQYRAGEELAKWLKENDQETKKIIFDLGLEYKP